MSAPEEHTPSPFVQMIGAKIEEWHQGYVRMSLVVEEKHTNPNGVMHGGVLTTLMDETLGAVVASVRGMDVMRAAPHATVEMNVSFLAGARAGDDIVVEGRALKVGRSVAFGEAEARRRGSDDLVAKGRFTYVVVEPRGG
ncbi:MAG: PaaI family thioesterase [Chloroflexota bacterium]|nr:PaaI family thioesterase [Chloroflexota bacterium]